ncbi:hypothetical protein [Reichenbachiella agariperforans]|uniref:hypothetical protein n=1 Tax=Reichenbachiella agariperforans TaxID=156994 RepID=UPI001C07FE55|nr:hypothetical protein [Reichenbachiella agariperforans]MBU2915698.1 hypothetical protein [Reichenbachiella agariperforans]
MENYTTYVQETLRAMQQLNLVYNYNFLYFSNYVSPAEYGHPDGWVFVGEGSVGLDTSNNCCRLATEASGQAVLSQALHEFPRWQELLRSETVTAKAHVHLETEAAVSLSLSDGIVTKESSTNAAGDYELEVQLAVGAAATGLILKIECSTPNVVVDISKVYANIGSIALSNLACMVNGVIGERKQYIATENPPAQELSLCQSAEELGIGYSRLDSVLNHRYGKGENRSLLPDMRGYFSRAWNHGASIDPDANQRQKWGASNVSGDHVGTLELEEFKEHNHSIAFSEIATPVGQASVNLVGKGKTSTTMTGGNETRPSNISELYTIKWA